jgi:hypothetical protein
VAAMYQGQEQVKNASGASSKGVQILEEFY